MIRKVAVIMGSDSDWPVVKGACAQLKALDIPFEAHILSAHRTPAEAAEFAKSARANGFGVILCAAGMAAHLAGAFAANTTLPVIGIPMKGGAMDGLDALLATVQMPSGIPVATVALNGAKNAAWLAAEILALSDDTLAEKLAAEGISARVIDMHTIKPLDTELVLKAAKETGAIVTTEEANVLGGLGAAVAEYLSENYPVPVVRHGVNDEFGRSGKAPLVLDAYGVNADGIIAKVKHFFPIQSDIQRSRPLEVTH